MKFIEDHDAHTLQCRIALKHARQNAFGDHFDARIARHARIHPHPVADSATHTLAERLRHSGRHGARGEASRLEHEDALPAHPRFVEQC